MAGLVSHRSYERLNWYHRISHGIVETFVDARDKVGGPDTLAYKRGEQYFQ